MNYKPYPKQKEVLDFMNKHKNFNVVVGKHQTILIPKGGNNDL